MQLVNNKLDDAVKWIVTRSDSHLVLIRYRWSAANICIFNVENPVLSAYLYYLS